MKNVLKNTTALKMLGYTLAGIGMLVANQVGKLETKEAAEEAVDKALAERDQNKPLKVAR